VNQISQGTVHVSDDLTESIASKQGILFRGNVEAHDLIRRDIERPQIIGRPVFQFNVILAQQHPTGVICQHVLRHSDE
jgi:hypothetical protein